MSIFRHIFCCIATYCVLFTATYGQQRIQTPSVTWGSSFETSKYAIVKEIVGKVNGNYLVLYRNLEKYEILKVDQRGNVVQDEPIVLMANGKKRFLESLVLMAGKLYLFTSFLNQKHKKNYLFVESLDLNTLQSNGDTRMIEGHGYVSRMEKGKYVFKKSENDRHLLIALDYTSPGTSALNWTHRDFETKEQVVNTNTCLIMMLDHELQTQWSKEIEMRTPDFAIAGLEWDVDAGGNFIMLAWKKMRSMDRKLNKLVRDEKSPLVFVVSNQGRSLVEQPLNFGNKHASSLKLTLAPDGQVVIAGFYRNTGTSGMDGLWSSKFPINGSRPPRLSFMEFGKTYLEAYLTEDERETAAKKLQQSGETYRLPGYAIKQIFPQADGSLRIAAELTSITYMHRQSKTGPTTIKIFNAHDIMIVDLASNGSITGVERICKTQALPEGFASFIGSSVSESNGTLCFLFNTHRKNLEPDNEQEYKLVLSDCAISATIVCPGAAPHSTALHSELGPKFNMFPKSSFVNTDGSILFFGKIGPVGQFARVTFR